MNRKSVVRFCVTLIAISILAATSSCSRDRTAAQAGGDGKSGGRGGRGGAGGTGMVLPVGVVAAKTDSFPVYINAIGTASAWNTVTVRSRVDGALMKLHFTEGQRVKAGDMLAEIDPRPYQVQLEQAQGQLARDQALLANAKLDLQRYLDAKEAVTQQQIDTARQPLRNTPAPYKSTKAPSTTPDSCSPTATLPRPSTA